MPSISRARALLYLGAALLALIAGGRLLVPGHAQPTAERPLEAVEADPTPAIGTGTAEVDPGTEVVVHVAGAVHRPGLYRLDEGSRIADAIREAGGATRRAALVGVNLARKLIDGEQVVVPARNASGAVPQPASAADAGPVRLSLATIEMLDALPGIGPVTAQKIIDYREEHGPFTSVDELDAIPGIGPARVEQLRGLVVP